MSFDNPNSVQLSAEEQKAVAAMVEKVQKQAAVTAKQMDKGTQLVEAQRGEALAELAINEARHQGGAWTRFYRDMLALTVEGRAGFRKVIAKHRKEVTAHVKAADDATPFKRASASALTRLSELTSISKALDVGVEFEKEWPFHYAVGYARTALGSEAKGRGRPQKPWMDKLKEFLNKNIPEDKREECAEFVETWAQNKDAPEV